MNIFYNFRALLLSTFVQTNARPMLHDGRTFVRRETNVQHKGVPRQPREGIGLLYSSSYTRTTAVDYTGTWYMISYTDGVLLLLSYTATFDRRRLFLPLYMSCEVEQRKIQHTANTDTPIHRPPFVVCMPLPSQQQQQQHITSVDMSSPNEPDLCRSSAPDRPLAVGSTRAQRPPRTPGS